MKQFVAVARRASFLAASRDLDITQPALSYQIRQLEEEFGTALFERHSRGVELTAAGEVLLKYSEAISDAVRAAEAELAAIREGAVQTLAIGASPTPSRTLVPDLLAACSPTSGLLISIQPGVSDEHYEDVLAGRLHGAFCYDPAVTDRLHLVFLYSEDIFLIGPPDVVDGFEDGVPFQELGRFPLVMDRRFVTSRRRINEAATAANVALDIREEVDAIDEARDRLIEGGLCTLAPYGLLNDDIERGVLVARQVREPAISRTLCLVLRRDIPDKTIEQLMSLMSGIVRENINDGRLGWRLPQLRSLFP